MEQELKIVFSSENSSILFGIDLTSGPLVSQKIKNQIPEWVADGVIGILNSNKGSKRISVEIDGEEKDLYLDNTNFKIESKNWEEQVIDGQRIKINPSKDIIEYLEGDRIGEQQFTWQAAIRETKKKGKRLFSKEEFNMIVKKIGTKGFFKDSGNDVYFWTATRSYGVHFCQKSFSMHSSIFDENCLFSIRALKG